MKLVRLKGTALVSGLAVLLGSLYIIQSSYTVATASQADDARKLFEKKCATCHGKDGRAKTFKAKFNHARNLTDPQWQADVTDERLFNSITNGKGDMPRFKGKLTDDQINELIKFIRTLK